MQVSLLPLLPQNNQWIELYNPGAAIKTVDDNPLTIDIDERLTLVFYTQHELKNGGVPSGTLPITITGTQGIPGTTTIHDRIGTLGATGAYWSPIGVGQSGRTSVDPGQDVLAISPTQEVISMSRVLDAAGAVTDGQVKAGWTAIGTSKCQLRSRCQCYPSRYPWGSTAHNA